MTATTEPPRAGFRLSLLIRDTRYRAITIQVLALAVTAAVLYWLGWNTTRNLAAMGKQIDFSFIWGRAGYDISQTLIPYTADSTHARAALVGVLNTLLVSALAIVLATVIGVFVGVLRLSNNWLVARLMTVYVEVFRNVPLLLWILLIGAIVIGAAPEPRAFRDGTASMILGSTVAVSNRGIFIPAPVIGPGAGWLALVVVLSIAAALLWRWRARRILYTSGRMVPVLWPALALLVLPGLAVWAGFTLAEGEPLAFDVPAIAETGIPRFVGGMQLRGSLLALWLALSLYTASHIAENVRGGILAISRGQTEAAHALGLRSGRTMQLVILPQALRVIVPPLISQYLNIIKNSSLGLAVGYMDLRSTLGGITINQTGRELEGMLLLGLFYLVISLIISGGMNLYNNHVRLRER
ncbi:MAG: ABC transporter permease subunit [Rubellimicrobium sp.]|nr:ABC transporter permease subunit [Rubellimicrobium sp.]